MKPESNSKTNYLRPDWDRRSLKEVMLEFIELVPQRSYNMILREFRAWGTAVVNAALLSLTEEGSVVKQDYYFKTRKGELTKILNSGVWDKKLFRLAAKKRKEEKCLY